MLEHPPERPAPVDWKKIEERLDKRLRDTEIEMRTGNLSDDSGHSPLFDERSRFGRIRDEFKELSEKIRTEDELRRFLEEPDDPLTVKEGLRELAEEIFEET